MSEEITHRGSRRRFNATKARLHFALTYADGFQDWLEALGYAPGTVGQLCRQLAHWADWLHKAGFGLNTIRAGHEACAVAIKGTRDFKPRRRAGALFIRHLECQGIIAPPLQPQSAVEIWPILGEFRTWMRAHRGVSSSSLDTYQITLIDLMRSLGDDPQAYTPQAIRGFVLERAGQRGKASAKVTVTAMRAFLRYLAAIGRCPVGLVHAVPNFAGSKLASTPPFLDAQEIERVIAACAGEKRLRDRAVILLLARLGLRASEVANLEFGHIDWENGRLAIVAGKSRRTEWLPLPQEVGEALIAYAERARPAVTTPHLFITAQTPRRPINRVVVNDIVQFAVERAGIESSRKGSHLLRHSAATAMLRNGMSLAGVGAMLRHRSVRTTLHYAKVDFASLAEIAQPWMGRSAC